MDIPSDFPQDYVKFVWTGLNPLLSTLNIPKFDLTQMIKDFLKITMTKHAINPYYLPDGHVGITTNIKHVK